jgi:hypothetical protein
MFVTWCVHRAAAAAGVQARMPKSASASGLWGWCAARGLGRTEPAAGRIGFVVGGPTGYSHAFLVEAVERDVRGEVWVVTIEGNWRNAVGRGRRRAATCRYAEVV